MNQNLVPMVTAAALICFALAKANATTILNEDFDFTAGQFQSP